MADCAHCGSPLPLEARFCPQCGAQRPLPQPAPLADAEWCEIRWWRGYVKSEFLVHPLGPTSAEGLPRGRAFRWRKSVPPPLDDEGARRAHEELVEALTRQGWESTGIGSHWFAQRFRRPLTTIQPIRPADDNAA